MTWAPTRPHASLHYCNLPTGQYESSDRWNRLLRKAADSLLAPLEVTQVVLVDVRPDNVTKDLTWTAVSDPIPLAG
ncbi:hypothetical protein [Nocardia puris]|uniref:hypothetical protein n=1 Tax=Nocardia puris TaxID=208602 RepID=UPI002E1A0CB8